MPNSATQEGLAPALTFAVAQVGSGDTRHVKVVLAATDEAPPLTAIGVGTIHMLAKANSADSTCIVGAQAYTFAPAIVSCAHAETTYGQPWVMHEYTCPSSSGAYGVDYNEAPAAPAVSPLSVAENTAYQGSASAADPDGDPVTFALCSSSDPNYHADTALFSITSAGVLSSSGPFDFETKSTYNVCVVARDDRNGSQSALRTITVLDANENRPPVISGLSPLAVDENAAYVGTIAASDPDAGDSIAAYRLSSACTGANNNGLFTINAANKLVPASGAAFDYEALPAPTLAVCVEVEDQGGLTAHAAFAIAVNNREDVGWGDCNISGKVNAADLTSTVLEIWDDEAVDNWLDAPFDNFRGSPEGCNSNRKFFADNTLVNVADVQCTVNIIFGEACAANLVLGGAAANGARPASVRAGDTQILVTLDAQKGSVAAAGFTLVLGPNVVFDAKDADGDGIPDAVAFSISARLHRWARYNAARHTVQVVIADVDLSGASLNGALATVTVSGDASAADAVQLTDASAGSPAGADLPPHITFVKLEPQTFQLYLPAITIK